jgi:hypothetical protein
VDCSRARSLLHPWLDGELERTEHTQLVDHLTRCEQCDARFRDEQRFLKRVQTGLAAPCPSELRARVFAQLCLVPARPGIFSVRRFAAAAAVAVLGVTFFAVDPICLRGCPTVHALTQEYDEPIASACSCSATIADDILQKIATKVPECVRIPLIAKGWHPIGRRCHGRGCLVYFEDDKGHKICFFKLCDEKLHPYLERKVESERSVATHQDGCRFFAWREQTELCGFIGKDDVPEAELVTLAGHVREP